jgi:ketosteroid isomerase-like protein
VEIAKRALDAFNRRDSASYGDPVDPEASGDLYAPDLEWFPAGPLALQGEGYAGYRGREGLETYLSDRRVMWEEIGTVEAEFRDLGDCVLMLGRLQVRVRSSGVTLDSPSGVIFDFRDGKISRMRAYLDHGEALRAAGVSEASGQADV